MADGVTTPTPDAAVTPQPDNTPIMPDLGQSPTPVPPPPASVPTGPAQAPASAGVNSPGPGGVLGDIAIGSLNAVAQRANKSNAAQSAVQNVGNGIKAVGRGLSSGFRQQAQERNLHIQDKQQDISDKQQAAKIAATRSQEETVKNMSAEQIQQATLAINNTKAHVDAINAAKLDRDDETSRNVEQQKYISFLDSEGLEGNFEHGPGHDGLTSEDARKATDGSSIHLYNGKTGQDHGVVTIDTHAMQNTPLQNDWKYVNAWKIDPKTGEAEPSSYRVLAGDGHTTLMDTYNAHEGSLANRDLVQKQFDDTEARKDAITKASKAATEAAGEPAKEAADVGKTKAETADEYAKAENQKAQAIQAGGGINDQNRALTGEPFVKTLPAQQQDLVRGIGKYQIDSKDLPRGKEKLPIMAGVLHAYGPDGWSEAKYDERRDYLKKYGSSDQGDGATRNRLVTAIGHLDMAGQASQLLSQSNSLPIINQLANSMGVPMGQSAKLVVDSIAEKAAGEIAGAIKGGGNSPTDPAIEQSLKSLALPNMTPQQRADVLRTQFGILNTQVGTIRGKFKSTMGQTPEEFGQPVLFGNSQQILDKWTNSSGGIPQTAKIGGQEYPIQSDGTIVINGAHYKVNPDGHGATLVAPNTGGTSGSF